MSFASTAALIAVTLAIAFNALPLVTSTDPPGTQLAAVNQGATPGSAVGTERDTCTFPTGDVFAADAPVPAGRTLDTIPDMIVLLDAAGYTGMDVVPLQVVDGRMEDPSDPFRAGWYEPTSTPDEGGNVVMAGYVDDWNIGPTPLAKLGNAAEGDEIQVNTPGGTSYIYAVEWVRSYEVAAITDADSAEVLGPTAEPALTIITCGGEFDYDAGVYLGRTVVRARLESSFDATAGEATPPASPVATPAAPLVNAEPRPYTREDCDVEPRTREDLIEILSELPQPLGMDTRTDEPRPLDQVTFDQLQDTVHDFQACQEFGMTFHWTTFLSENALRRMVYRDGQTTPYSATVLDEIVRGWEEIDAARSERAGESGTPCGVVLVPNLPSEGPLYASDALIQVPAVLAAGDQVVNTSGMPMTVQFVAENGHWQIAQFPENFTNCA